MKFVGDYLKNVLQFYNLDIVRLGKRKKLTKHKAIA